MAKRKSISPQKGFQDIFVKSNVDVAFGGGSMSSGKALALDELVCTPSGFKETRDIVVGDIISNPNCTNKVSVVTELHPIQEFPFYRIEFADRTYVDCSEGHLWRVKTKKDEWLLWDAKTIYCWFSRFLKSNELYIPLTAPVRFEERAKELPLNPYTMGTLIGDRYLNFKAISDPEIKSAIEYLSMRECGVNDRFIPKMYMFASIEDRWNLIKGLVDTNGYNEFETDKILYRTTSEQLAKDVAFVARSLGRMAAVRQVKSWYITIIEPESVTEKPIKSITFIGNKVGRCITVDNPTGLFITNDFTVTHNSFGAILSLAEPILDPNFRAVFIRRNLNETKVAGGLFEDTKKVYAPFIKSAKESDNPRIVFKSGAFVDFTHISDESPTKLLERIRGWQYDLIYLDEGTSYEWTTFRLLFSRNRGTGKWTNKMRLTCNPKKSHWLREFLTDYIGIDGYIRPDWDGKVRYFYIKGKEVSSVVWGDTPEEVYSECRYQIDEALQTFRKKGMDVDYRSMIKSFSFYLGSPAENKAMVGANQSYLGSVAAMGEVEARANLLGNWNIDIEGDEGAPLKYDDIIQVFSADPQINNDKWITVDLADTGVDNTMILVWDGFHVIDYKILMKSTPRINADAIQVLAEKHDIGDSNIVYDGVRAVYINDYIPAARPFISYRVAMGRYGRMAENLKTECYLRLVEMIKRGGMSFDDKIANATYSHQNAGIPITFKTEFIEECSVIRFKELPSGKKRLINKKDMNLMLGKGRSMDLLDCCNMRMYPVLGYNYGEELMATAVEIKKHEDVLAHTVDIYDETNWF